METPDNYFRNLVDLLKSLVPYFIFYMQILKYYYIIICAVVVTAKVQQTHCSRSSMKSSNLRTLPLSNWIAQAQKHRIDLDNLIYPNLGGETNPKKRMHSVAEHPIYNFLHRYYSYSSSELMRFSPGINVLLDGAQIDNHGQLLSNKFVSYGSKGCIFGDKIKLPSRGRFSRLTIINSRNVLHATTKKQPFFACYGLHEWAMLYSGHPSNRTESSGDKGKRHQESLQLRVPQTVIDEVVESNTIRCTHFDAWRFFHPDAQHLNAVNPLTRGDQVKYEQAGCIHATMDLFKYAYQLYPLVPSSLLLDSLRIALKARMIDMRASPYDVSAYDGCEVPIEVNTAAGRHQYAIEQEELYQESRGLREDLLNIYNYVLLTAEPVHAVEEENQLDHELKIEFQ